MKTLLFALAASALAATAAVADPADESLQHWTQGPAYSDSGRVAKPATAGRGAVVRMRQLRDVEVPAARRSSTSAFDWDGNRNNG
jgi:hypothetical protein